MNDTVANDLPEQVRELATRYYEKFFQPPSVLFVGMAQIWEMAGMAMDSGMFDRNETPKFFLGFELRLHDEPLMKMG